MRPGQLLYLDTNCFIYLFEDHPQFGELAQRVFSAVEHGHYRAMTSALTLMEAMAGPIKLGEELLAAQYADLMITFPNLVIRDMDIQIARRAAIFRALGISAPDAIHLATAVCYEAEYFVTGDKRLGRIKGIEILHLSELPPFERLFKNVVSAGRTRRERAKKRSLHT